MRITKLFIAVLLLSLISNASLAAVPDYAKPINAYQSKYDMSFFVWKPIGLQNKWYTTYDGYPVTEITKDRWVYGVIGHSGQLTESLITVGSVDPSIVYILAPLPPYPNDSLFKEKAKITDSLKSIFKTKCDSFAIAYTNASYTPIAWESRTSRAYMWGGYRWVPIFLRHGEKLRDTIKRDSNLIARMLRACNITWTQIDTLEFANYVRSAGYAWIDDFETNMPPAFSDINFGHSGGGSRSGQTGKSNEGASNSEGGGWDTGKP